MDVAILAILIIILSYLIIRDSLLNKKRRKTYLLIKRNSAKIDYQNKEIKKQNKLFNQLLDILSDEPIQNKDDEHSNN